MALSKKFVMIKLDQQKRPPALKRFAQYGGYVPRFFFLKSDGSLDATITSGHARFPYFYSSRAVAKLRAAMGKALGG